jgi:hypothetical protein
MCNSCFIFCQLEEQPNYEYVACFKDKRDPRVFEYLAEKKRPGRSGISMAKCVEACLDAEVEQNTTFNYVGREAHDCYCAAELPLVDEDGQLLANDYECYDKTCNGKAKGPCGKKWRLAAYTILSKLRFCSFRHPWVFYVF